MSIKHDVTTRSTRANRKEESEANNKQRCFSLDGKKISHELSSSLQENDYSFKITMINNNDMPCKNISKNNYGKKVNTASYFSQNKDSNLDGGETDRNKSASQELNDQVNNLDFDLNCRIAHEAEGRKNKAKEDNCTTTPIETGILSNIKNLTLDISGISDSSPIGIVNRKDASPFNNGEDNPFYSWKLEKGSEKNYPPKTKVCKDDSASNTPNSQLNFSTFSNYLENNPILKYFDYSPSRKNRGSDTPVDPSKLTKPEVFIQQVEREKSKKSQEKEQENIGETNNFHSKVHPVIKNCEKVNNTFLNMNVNMNVLNNQPYFMNQHAGGMSTSPPKGNYMNQIINPMSKVNSNLQLMSTLSENPEGFSKNYGGMHKRQMSHEISSANNQYIGARKKSVVNYPQGYTEEALMYGNPVQPVQGFQMPQNPQWNWPQNSFPQQQFIGGYDEGFYQQPQPGYEKMVCGANMPVEMNMNNQMPGVNNVYSSYNYQNLETPAIFREPKGPKLLKQQVPNFMSMNPEELARHAYVLSKDQSGCRFLQKKIEEEPEIASSLIYPALLENIIELINDAFGNYLIQKLFDYLSEDKFYQLMAIISPHLSYLGMNPHGTRVIQKLLDYLSTEELVKSFIIVLKPHVLTLMKDMNGNHIIHKLIQCFPSNSMFIYDTINENIIEIATHKHGCCVLQKCIENSNMEAQEKIICTIIQNCLILVVDQYGNYVIQYILSMNNIETNDMLISLLMKNITYYSKQKYSSNVIEKCFDFCDDEKRMTLIEEVSKPEVVIELLCDMFGNYVVQKALSCSSPERQNYLLILIAPLLSKLKMYSFGPKLYNKLLITYPQLSTLMFSMPQNMNMNQVNSFNHFSGKLPTHQMKMQMNQMNYIQSMPVGPMENFNSMPMNINPTIPNYFYGQVRMNYSNPNYPNDNN